MTINEATKSLYTPTAEEAVARNKVYGYLQTMRDLKDKAMPHFQSGPNGPRSWLQMLDDAEALVNIYTPSREESGKGDWQSNANAGGAEVRAKMRAVAAGVGLKVPDMEFEATNKDGIRSVKRAEIFKNITKQTYQQGNPALSAFLETWQMLGHGVVFEYEGYKTGGCTQERVVGFNTLTGEITTKKEYVKMDGKPFNVILNPQEFFWWSFLIRDVQDQPRVAWVQSYTRSELELEFSKYKNYSLVKSRKEMGEAELNDSWFFQKSNERNQVDAESFQVLRMYSKEDDRSSSDVQGYEIWVNGVPLLRCPLLWGDKEKAYPFAKSVPEYFANSNFFVGMPFPIGLEGYVDNKNMLLNSLVDKVVRGLDPLKLVGLQNRDLLDVESEIHTEDSTIYVPDISAVKFMDHPMVNQGELMLMQMLDRGIELVSIDRTQQGQNSGGRKTAREMVIADQRAQELKGNLYLSLEDLWYQKTKLRVKVILSHYLRDKAASDSIKDQIISIKDYTFGDGTRGTLDIHVAKTKGKLLTPVEIEAREKAMKEQGQNYKLISLLQSYLNDYVYDFRIIPASIAKRDQMAEEEEVMGEIQALANLNPAFVAANTEKYTKEILELRGHHMDEYNPTPPPPPPAPSQKVIESMNYKDAPPDIRRQMEKQAGLVPSTAEEVSPNAPDSPEATLGIKKKGPVAPPVPSTLDVTAPVPTP